MILNLGCGGKVSDHPDVVNVDWSIALRLKRSSLMRYLAPLYLSGERLVEFRTIPKNILVRDLSAGLPFEDHSIDAVYHCHVLEHIDRDQVEKFLLEVQRVLRQGGVHRIVVPDFALQVKRYLSHLEMAGESPAAQSEHDRYIATILEQSVRTESDGTRRQPPLRRWLESRLFGDARRRGETHQWMYDRINLSWMLTQAGYSSVSDCTYQTSAIPNWETYGLDCLSDGGQYKPGSIYMEAIK